jgi:lysozyme family protein
MKDSFVFSLNIVLEKEGGFVNHPKDPGGATNLGVTKAVWESWIGKKVTVDDIKKLTVKDVTPLYKKNYWDKVRGDELPTGLDLCVFDFGVNAGPGRAIKYLQRMVGAKEDGVFGPGTLKAVQEFVAKNGEKGVVKIYSNMRRAYYKSLSTFPTFGRGWLRRVDEVEKRALTL